MKDGIAIHNLQICKMLKIRKTKPLPLWSKIEENQKLSQLSNYPSPRSNKHPAPGCFVAKLVLVKFLNLSSEAVFNNCIIQRICHKKITLNLKNVKHFFQ